MSLDTLSVVLIALAIGDWCCTAIIYLIAHRLSEPALDERAVTSLILSVIATVGAILGATRLGFVALPSGGAVVLLSLALVLVSLPQFIWAVGALAGKFR